MIKKIFLECNVSVSENEIRKELEIVKNFNYSIKTKG